MSSLLKPIKPMKLPEWVVLKDDQMRETRDEPHVNAVRKGQASKLVLDFGRLLDALYASRPKHNSSCDAMFEVESLQWLRVVEAVKESAARSAIFGGSFSHNDYYACIGLNEERTRGLDSNHKRLLKRLEAKGRNWLVGGWVVPIAAIEECIPLLPQRRVASIKILRLSMGIGLVNAKAIVDLLMKELPWETEEWKANVA
jgi:hypothetical protein